MMALFDKLEGLETRYAGIPFETVRIAVLAGEPGAWRKFVEKYSRFVYTVALKLLGGVDEREDKAATVYTRVFERLQGADFRLLRQFQGKCRFNTYLYRMVQSERKELFRKISTESKYRADEDVEEQASAPFEPVLQPNRIAELVREAIDRLEPEDRLMLLLRYHDGLKLREIAALQGESDINRTARTLYGSLEKLDLLRKWKERHNPGEEEIKLLHAALENEFATLAREESR